MNGFSLISCLLPDVLADGFREDSDGRGAAFVCFRCRRCARSHRSLFSLFFFRPIHQYSRNAPTARAIPPTNAGIATAKGKAVAFLGGEEEVAAVEATTETVTMVSRSNNSVMVGVEVKARGKEAELRMGFAGSMLPKRNQAPKSRRKGGGGDPTGKPADCSVLQHCAQAVLRGQAGSSDSDVDRPRLSQLSRFQRKYSIMPVSGPLGERRWS